MDDTVERQSDMSGAGPVSSPQTDTAQGILGRLTRWQEAVEPRLQAQMTLLQVLEEYSLVELRTHYYEGNIDPHFIGTLLDTVLQRMIDQKPLAFDEEQDAPYRWPEGADPGFAAERREVIIQVVESIALRAIKHYQDYLQRHWRMTGDDAFLEGVVKQKLDDHIARINLIFQPDQLAGLDVDELREKIEKLQDAWRRMSQLTALATPQERQSLEAIARLQLPDWLRGLSEAERKWLKFFQDQTFQAQTLVDELLDGLGSLRAFARKLAKDYVRRELDMEVEPDSIRVQLQWRAVIGQPVQTHRLSELLAAGPVRPDAVSVFLVENGAMLRNQPLSPAFITQLLADVDAPAGYLNALASRYSHGDLQDAMLDWLTVRLQQSAFIARCAGHLRVSNYDALRSLWESEATAQSAPVLRVACLVLPNALKCVDLLLFYREDVPGEISDLLLYAPDKPDGQEWIELPSLRAVSAEMGTWIASEAGREYLLQKLSPTERGAAREYFAGVVDKPTAWDLNKDLRSVVTGFRACLESAVAMGLANNLAQVELDESPRWYSVLPLELRRNISSLRQELLVHQQAFNEQLAGYEVFVDFAKRTVTQAIAPYMRSKGVLEPVDPATVLIDYSPGLAGDKTVASLLDLAIYGYDDNSGIDNPAKGVRSSVGQELGQVRSADLALYIRSAYLGEQYAQQIRARFLDADAPQYAKRRDAYRYMQLARMDHDLRVAHGKSMLNTDQFQLLTRQVTRLGDWEPAQRSPYPGSAVTQDGVIKFTVGGHVVLGVYVFIYFDPRASYWLYTPDAPDGVAFRRYQDFSGGIAAQLHDYVLERVALTARAAVRRSLVALAAGSLRVDTLREFNRVTDIKAEFDAYIERAVTDVEDITTSHAEVIKNQVVKGLLFASAPVCMVYPPFALLLDIAFVAISSKQAVEAHLQGDTQGALGHWLKASWGALFGMLGAANIASLLGRAVGSLKLAVKPVSLSAQRLRNVTSVATKETGPMVQPIRFKAKQAVRNTPENLQWVTKEGIFQGTYLRPPTASQPRSAYYIRNKGKYYQVRENRYFSGLCLVDARRPAAIYKLPIRRMANGRWTRNEVGLRGGNDEVLNLGRVDDLRMAFPGHVSPDVTRGALQGEAVVAKFSEAAADNYLFSLNAQTCVIASLYNPIAKVGAVIHFDHNIGALIERSVRDVMRRLGGSAQDIRATLVGGDWLTGADIGGPVRSVMRRQGLLPTWDHWSYSSCLGNTYGVSLDLRSGVTSVFKTSRGQVERYYIPVLARAKQSHDAVSARARGFMTRLRSEVLVENANGVVLTQQGRRAATSQIDAQAFATVALG
jgi:hypothetical protein